MAGGGPASGAGARDDRVPDGSGHQGVGHNRRQGGDRHQHRLLVSVAQAGYVTSHHLKGVKWVIAFL